MVRRRQIGAIGKPRGAGQTTRAAATRQSRRLAQFTNQRPRIGATAPAHAVRAEGTLKPGAPAVGKRFARNSARETGVAGGNRQDVRRRRAIPLAGQHPHRCSLDQAAGRVGDLAQDQRLQFVTGGRRRSRNDGEVGGPFLARIVDGAQAQRLAVDRVAGVGAMRLHNADSDGG